MSTAGLLSHASARFHIAMLVATASDVLRGSVAYYGPDGDRLATVGDVTAALTAGRRVTLQDPMPGQETLPR